jgi:hypothetical protein
MICEKHSVISVGDIPCYLCLQEDAKASESSAKVADEQQQEEDKDELNGRKRKR